MPRTLPALHPRLHRPLLAALALLALTGCPAPAVDDKVDEDGTEDGAADGAVDGTADGNADGAADGAADGTADGAADGTADGGDGGTPTSEWYADADGDGFGDPGRRVDAVEAPEGHVADSTDCDDSDPDVNPEATEVCDGRDNDCDGERDPTTAEGATLWYADLDGDSYGDPAASTTACAAPAGHVADNNDCAPTEATAYPGSAAWEHIGDGVDQDCDGYDGCEDLDCDGLPDLVMPAYNDGDYITESTVYFGGGGFAESRRLSVATAGAHWAGAEDLDGDGYKEVLLLNHYNGSSYINTLDIYPGTPTGPDLGARFSLPAAGGLRVLVHDLDDDGDPDLFVLNRQSSSTSYTPSSVIYWNEAGAFDALDSTELPTLAPYEAEAADLNADGYVDLAICNFWDGSTRQVSSYVYWGSASGYSSTNRTGLPTLGCTDLGVGDFDGDGHLDVAFANSNDNVRHDINSYVYWGSAAGFSTSNRGGLPTWGTIDLDVGDANNDGLPDLAFAGYNDGGGGFTSAAYTAHYTASTAGFSTGARELWDLRGAEHVSFADLDKDGYAELLVARLRSSTTAFETSSMIYWGSVGGYTSSTALPTTGAHMWLAGDLDRDGVPDLLSTSSRDNAGATGAGSLIYWGSGSGRPSYSTADRTELNTVGVGDRAVVVGDASW